LKNENKSSLNKKCKDTCAENNSLKSSSARLEMSDEFIKEDVLRRATNSKSKSSMSSKSSKS
jgi:hypothetical protein